MPELFRPYSERTITVVGGKGALGSRVVAGVAPMGFREVQVCEKGDPFLDFVERSTDLFFAVDNTEITDMLQASRDYLTPNHTILDGSSVKGPLITTYRELDNLQISVASTHLGAVPAQPWRGIKVWVCEVGPNSERAKRLAFNLFLSTNSSIQTIDISEHRNVERDQWLTMATAHIFAAALRNAGFSLGEFDLYATLNAELQALPVGRTLGQGTRVPSEIIANQPLKKEYMEALREGLRELESVLEDRDKLQAWMQQNIDFHDGDGTVSTLFKKAGVIGARNANLRMHSFSFRIINDQPGALSNVLEPFHAEGANLTAIDSMPGIATDEELSGGVDPDKIVDFDIGIDPKTIDPDKEKRIKKRLVALGCVVS
jgi:prephenate dehydrogenase